MPCQLCCKSFVSQLDIDQDQYFEALIDLSRWENDYMFRQLREVVNRTDWRSHGTVTEVNAFYVPWENSMVECRAKRRAEKIRQPVSNQLRTLPFRSIHIAGDSHSRDVIDLVHCMMAADKTVKGVCRPGVGLLSVTSNSPLPLDSCYTATTSPSASATFKKLERCFTSKLRTAKVVVSTLRHRHDLPAQQPINKETSLINAYIEELCVRQSGVEVPQCTSTRLVECMGVFSRAVRTTSRQPPLEYCRPPLPQTDHLSKTSVACKSPAAVEPQMLAFETFADTFIISGDFNIDVLDYTNSLTQQLRNILTSFGLVWSVNTPTRVSATWSTAIDNVITNVIDVSVSVLHPAISDYLIGYLSPKFEPLSENIRRDLEF
ncbi:NEDD8 protease nep2 [Homalodisca vitripennis]|nr:NEDD8 protease nep2 [Homalodisca vitripennis]